MLPSLIIVDDFLKDPSQARAQAFEGLKTPLPNKGNYPGVMTRGPIAFEGVTEAVSRLVNTPLTPMPGSLHGHCRLTLKAEKGRSGVHIDPCDYSGILFLSLTEDSKGGTDFFRHRATGLDRVPTTKSALAKTGFSDVNTLVETIINRESLLPTRWERLMRVPMRYNRLILFSPWLFHNAGPGFGDRPETGRLVSLLFFNRKTRT